MTFAELKNTLIAHTHPAGLPDNLVTPYETFILESLVYLQKWVKCLQEHHVDIYPFCGSYIACNATVVSAPQGRITRVYTVSEDSFCDPIQLKQVTHDELLCEAEKISVTTSPPTENSYGLPYPFAYAYVGTDRTCGRAKYGFYSLHNSRIYIAPFMDSEERIVVEWDGLKRSYEDDDSVSDDPEVFRAIKLFVRKEMAMHFEHDQEDWERSSLEFRECMADLINECNEQIRIRESGLCGASDCIEEC